MDNDKKTLLEKIANLDKSWWAGDPRIEPYMIKVSEALTRRGVEGDARTDIYNRAYEAIYYAIKDYGKELAKEKEKE